MSPGHRWMVVFRYRRLGQTRLWNPDRFEAHEWTEPAAGLSRAVNPVPENCGDGLVAIRMMLEIEPQVGKDLHTCLGAARRQADAQFQSRWPDATLGYWW